MGNITFKFIQINIYKGKYLNELVDFIKCENPDFISMQEVTSGVMNRAEDKSADLFEVLKKSLSMEGVRSIDYTISDGEGSFGNAVFSRHPIRNSNLLRLKPQERIPLARSHDEDYFPQIPRNLLDAICEIKGEIIHVMSWHGAWTAPPTDTVETLTQAEKIANYLSNLSETFVLGCDSNNVIQSKTIGLINKVSNNLLLDSGVLGTTNLKIHKISPVTYLIDYIFTSKNVRKLAVSVPKITISDHLPVVAELALGEEL